MGYSVSTRVIVQRPRRDEYSFDCCPYGCPCGLLIAGENKKTLKLSRTITDLDGAEEIRTEHVTEAIQYRNLDRNLWT